MLKMRPSARLRVATSSISVSLSATTFSRTTSSAGAPLSSTTTWAPATPARSSMMSWRKPLRRVTVPTRPTLASGFSTASSVTRTVSATGRPLTSCASSAYSNSVTLPRRHSRSQVVGGRCAALAAALHAQTTSSSPTIVLFFTSFPSIARVTAPDDLAADDSTTRTPLYNPGAPMRRQSTRFEKGDLMRRAGGIVSVIGLAAAIALATPFDSPFGLAQGTPAARAQQGGTPAAAAAQRYTTWQSYAGGAHSSQYSALDQINRQNVAKLQVAWTYPVTGNSIFNPVVVDGVMYVPVGGG